MTIRPTPIPSTPTEPRNEQKDRKERRWIGLKKHPVDLQWTTKIEKGGKGDSIVKIFWSIELKDLWSKGICRPKLIVSSPVLHSSLDDLVDLS